MTDREHEQPSLDHRFVHDGELSVAQSTGSLETAAEVSKGYANLEHPAVLPEYEKHAELVQNWHDQALQRADRLFDDIGRALHQPDVGQVPEVVNGVIGAGRKMQQGAEAYLSRNPEATADQYDLAYFKVVSEKKASSGASDAKYANLDATPLQRRRQQNKLAGEARQAVAPRLEENIINRRLYAEFGDTLETLAGQLEEKRSAQTKHAA